MPVEREVKVFRMASEGRRSRHCGWSPVVVRGRSGRRGDDDIGVRCTSRPQPARRALSRFRRQFASLGAVRPAPLNGAQIVVGHVCRRALEADRSETWQSPARRPGAGATHR